MVSSKFRCSCTKPCKFYQHCTKSRKFIVFSKSLLFSFSFLFLLQSLFLFVISKSKKEGSQLYDFIGQLKILSSEGKYCLRDMGDTEQILRLIKSIPSKKAEPFKLWLARAGSKSIKKKVFIL